MTFWKPHHKSCYDQRELDEIKEAVTSRPGLDALRWYLYFGFENQEDEYMDLKEYMASAGSGILNAATAVKKMYDTKILTIASFEWQDFSNGTKPVVKVEEIEEGIVLNKTNAKALAAAFGDDENKWTGRKVMLLVLDKSFNNEVVKGITLKPVVQ